ncbi:hypothetical protein ACIGAN_02830 [Streptomyces sp. NPDC085931]|uniref:hypothetical protein n=1 Tax=Streptomyces sp. NPDC085931 TaxID=3365740 RepID=UPI0037D88A46
MRRAAADRPGPLGPHLLDLLDAAAGPTTRVRGTADPRHCRVRGTGDARRWIELDAAVTR